MRWVFWAVLLASISTFAVKFSREGSKLIMSDVACKDIQKNIDSLSAWSLNLNPNSKCTAKVEESKRQAGTCLSDISSCVPEHVLKYNGSTSEKDGPNCWNLALVMAQILPSMRYSTEREMSFYLESPLCRPLKNGEVRKPGDIGALRYFTKYKEQYEQHAFIYINDDLVYAKNGPDTKSRFALQNLRQNYSYYGLTKKSECQKNEIDPNAGCRVAVGYFRCQSMDSYLKENSDISPALTKIMKKFDAVEGCLEQHLVLGKPITTEARKSMIDVVSVLGKYYQQEVDKSPDLNQLSEKDRFILGSLNLRLAAIGEQVSRTDKAIADDLKRIVSSFFTLEINN